MAGERELRRALEHGFSPAELEQQLFIVRSRLETAAASAATRQSSALVRRLVQAIAGERIFTTPATDLALLGELTAGLSPAEVDATLARLFAGGEPQIVLTGPIELADPRAEILAAYAESRAQPVAPPEEPVATAFPYGDWGPPFEIAHREEIPGLGIIRVAFANGVQLDMRPTPYEADTVHVALRFGTGRIGMPADRPGLDLMAARAFVDGGLGRLDRDALARLTAGRQVGLDLTVADSALVLSGRTTRRDVPLQLDLLAAYVTDAAYRPEAEERYRAATHAAYARLAVVPQGARRGPVALFLHDGDPRFAMPPEAEAAARSMAELQAWLGPMLEEGPLQVAVVGDLEPERVIAEVGRTFGALPPRAAAGAPPEAPEIRLPGSAEPVRFEHRGASDRALAMVYWPTTGRDDQKLAIGLDLVADILRDRLFAEARGNLGATYSPSAASHASRALPGYGHIGAAVDATVADAERMARLIREVAAGMREGGISADDLSRALEPRLARARTTLEGNDYWLRGVLVGITQYPDRLDDARRYLADHEAQTLAAVQAVADRYLDPARALTIMILPADTGGAAPATPEGAASAEEE
jgi:zinc protease